MINFLKKHGMLIAIALVILMQFFRLFSGHGSNDEHFYSALAYKMATYGNLFVDDWDIGQMFVFLLIPFVKLYIAFFKSTDGIVLYFRVLYWVLTCITSLLIYKKFNEQYKFTKVAVLIYLIFVPFNIPSLSYNTLSINLLMQSICLYGLNDQRITSFLSGITFAGAVLASPYLAGIYCIFFIYHLVKFICCKKLANYFSYSFLGIVLLAVLFVINVFSGGSINVVINNLIATLNEPSYGSTIIQSILRVAYHAYTAFGYYIVVLGLFILVELIQPKQSCRICSYMMALLCILNGVFISPYNIAIGGHSIINLILTMLALPIIVKTKNKNMQFYFLIFIVHALIISISSNVGIRSTSNVLINAVVLFILLLESEELKPIIKYTTCAICVGVYLYTRLCFNYIEPVMNNVRITNGPLKYLVSDDEFVHEYDSLYQEVQYINGLEDANQIYIESDLSWIYSVFDQKEVINYSLIRHIYPKEDIVKRTQQFLDMHNLDEQYYVYIMDNTYDINIDDIWDNYLVIDDANINYGNLYLVG